MRTFDEKSPFYNPSYKFSRTAEALARNIQRLANHFHNWLLWKSRVAEGGWDAVGPGLLDHQRTLLYDTWQDIKGCETEARQYDAENLIGMSS